MLDNIVLSCRKREDLSLMCRWFDRRAIFCIHVRARPAVHLAEGKKKEGKKKKTKSRRECFGDESFTAVFVSSEFTNRVLSD
jgi:hypothetical protein